MAFIDDLKNKASELLSNAAVDVFIGFQKGTVPKKGTPAFFYSADEVSDMIFDSTCGNNLASYVKRVKKEGKKIGIAATGCISRSLVELMKNNQIERDSLYIVGIECGGVIDPNKEGETVSASCLRCTHRTPAVFDEMITGMENIAGEGMDDPYADVSAHEKLGDTEKWGIFHEEMSKCIRCYACRQVCPVCFCEQCFIDGNEPRMVGITDDFSDTAVFQMTRMLHVSGRCVDCGACERACPAGVNLGLFRLKIEKDIKEMYGYESGIDPEGKGALNDYKPDDTEDFMIHL